MYALASKETGCTEVFVRIFYYGYTGKMLINGSETGAVVPWYSVFLLARNPPTLFQQSDHSYVVSALLVASPGERGGLSIATDLAGQLKTHPLL